MYNNGYVFLIKLQTLLLPQYVMQNGSNILKTVYVADRKIQKPQQNKIMLTDVIGSLSD